MAKTKAVKSNIEFDVKITLELTLEEARALNQMTIYGSKAFLEGYYRQLGKSYLQPHEKGVVSLIETVRNSLPGELMKANEYMSAINTVIEKYT